MLRYACLFAHSCPFAFAQVLTERCDVPDFDQHLISECLRLLEDDEVRVRLAVGQLLRALTVKHGISVYEQCRQAVLQSIFNNFVS